VFAHARHTGATHPVEPSERQIADRTRPTSEGPIADHRIETPIQIEHRREAEIHADRAQLRGHQPGNGLAAGAGVAAGAP
jgi:hypothetical protein